MMLLSCAVGSSFHKERRAQAATATARMAWHGSSLFPNARLCVIWRWVPRLGCAQPHTAHTEGRVREEEKRRRGGGQRVFELSKNQVASFDSTQLEPTRLFGWCPTLNIHWVFCGLGFCDRGAQTSVLIGLQKVTSLSAPPLLSCQPLIHFSPPLSSPPFK